jgi:predicted membrane protein
MAQPKSKIIILVIMNTIFFIALGAYGMITLLSGIYFRKVIGFYGLISTIRVSKNWLLFGAIILVVFSIFYLSQIILISVNYYRIIEQNRKLKGINRDKDKAPDKPAHNE